MATKTQLLADIFSFLKTNIASGVSDPLTNRPSNSSFVMTSYPQKNVIYPLITIKCKNYKAKRAGMQTTAQDIDLVMEIRIWARNEKEKDNLFILTQNLLDSIQFTSTGSVANELHNFDVLSGVEIDEPGEQGIKSRIIQLKYQFYNLA